MTSTVETNQLIISPAISVKDAIAKMDVTAKRILLLVENEILIGVVTDGDIRRWILKGGPLSSEIGEAANKNPQFITEEEFSADKARKLMAKQRIECIPIVDVQKRIKSLVFWYDVFEDRLPQHMSLKMPVVIMAGGLGTRLHPFTKILLKPLIPIGDQPIIEHIMNRFLVYNCDEFFISVNYKSNMIRAYFSDHPSSQKLNFIEETTPLGTAGALSTLSASLPGTFFVTNCDILVEANYAKIVSLHRESKNLITVVASMKNFTVPYGVIELGKNNEIGSLKEKPEFNFLVNTGLYVMESEALSLIPANTRMDMTDLIQRAMDSGKRVGVFPVSEKSWTDMGQFEELENMRRALGIKE